MSVNSHSPKTTKSLALLFLGVGLILLGLASALLIPRAEAITSGEDDPAETGGLSAIPVEVSFPAPDLRLSDLSGQSFALSDFAGQMVLVNNWAIWCPPCKAELPDLNAFYLKYKAQGFVIVAIEAGSPQADVQTFIDQAGLAFPIWVDPQELAMEAFMNFSLPSSYLIDRTGQIRLAWTGAISAEMLEKHVAPLLSE
jgi:peroxiredoxin